MRCRNYNLSTVIIKPVIWEMLSDLLNEIYEYCFFGIYEMWSRDCDLSTVISNFDVRDLRNEIYELGKNYFRLSFFSQIVVNVFGSSYKTQGEITTHIKQEFVFETHSAVASGHQPNY